MSLFPTVFTPEKRNDFLTSLATTGNVRKAAEACGVSTRLAYIHRSNDAEFAQAWQDALTEAIETVLEPEALRRAVEGTDKAVYHNGEVVGYEKQYSDTLLIFLLKAARPEKYRETARRDDRQDISELLKAVLLELADRQHARDVTPEADWAPLPPGTRPPLPPPPDVDEEGG